MTIKTLNFAAGQEMMKDSPLAMAVQKAGEYESSIYISNGKMRANAKSLMGMMTMEVDPAEPVVITAEGPDEEEAASALANYLVSQIG